MRIWGFDSFRKYESNPILTARGNAWESLTVYNPAAWTDDDRVYLLYRAEGPSNFPDKTFTSRIGLAISHDGIHFERERLPVLEPSQPYEIPGGCEDPRIVQIDNVFYMTYTAYDGKIARLAMARSRDLHQWEKLGPLFPDAQWERYFPHEEHNRLFPKGWSKSGAILAQPINGDYWMYFGDTHIWAAYSKDLIHWDVVDEPVLSPRPNAFDSRLVEPGPPPLLLPEGIWLGYNGADSNLQYAFGQALFATDKPTKLIRRSAHPLLLPTTESEKTGQVPQVVFGEGLVRFRGKWFLYYGMADSRIGVAFAEAGEPNLG